MKTERQCTLLCRKTKIKRERENDCILMFLPGKKMCAVKTKVAACHPRNMSRVARLTDTDDIRRLRRHP